MNYLSKIKYKILRESSSTQKRPVRAVPMLAELSRAVGGARAAGDSKACPLQWVTLTLGQTLSVLFPNPDVYLFKM